MIKFLVVNFIFPTFAIQIGLYADVAQLARAADLYSAGRGFESLHRLQKTLRSRHGGVERKRFRNIREVTRVAKWGRL